jgi:hypothetical protein
MLERRSAGRTRRPTRIPKVRTTPSQQVVITAVAQPIDIASYTFTFSSSPCFVSSNLFLLDVLIPIHPPHVHLQQTIDKFLQKNLKTCEFSVVIIRKLHECSSSMSWIRKSPPTRDGPCLKITEKLKKKIQSQLLGIACELVKLVPPLIACRSFSGYVVAVSTGFKIHELARQLRLLRRIDCLVTGCM